MLDPLLLAADLVAVLVLVLGSYLPRHRRPDLVLPYVGLNVGVLAVATVLTGSAIGFGLGMGLFGVLSIIRLRSDELGQEEVAYYFAALALGLVFGLAPEPRWLAPVLGALLVAVVTVVDRLPLLATARRQVVTVDRVVPREPDLVAHLAELLDARVLRATVLSTDVVRDCMVVDVRYRVPRVRRGDGAGGPTVARLRVPAARTATGQAPATPVAP